MKDLRHVLAWFHWLAQFYFEGKAQRTMAIEYLEGIGRYSNRAEFPLPAGVLPDLRLPGN